MGPAPSSGPTLADVAWVIGDWETPPDEHGCTFHERWQRDGEALYTGHSHETCPTETEEEPFVEDLRIEADERGLVYVAWPTGQERTQFALTSGDADGFVAENPDHDFPTRIEYRYTATGIDAIVSGPGRTFTLSMHAASSTP